MASFVPLNTWSNGMDTALPNPPENLSRISLAALRLSPLSIKIEACNWPIEGFGLKVYFVSRIILSIFVCRYVFLCVCFVDDSGFVGF